MVNYVLHHHLMLTDIQQIEVLLLSDDPSAQENLTDSGLALTLLFNVFLIYCFFWIGIADNNTFYIAHRTYIKWFRHHSYLPLHLIRQHHYQLYNVLAPVLPAAAVFWILVGLIAVLRISKHGTDLPASRPE